MITLLLTLKGRAKLTPHFIDYFHFDATGDEVLYIADGSKDPQKAIVRRHGSMRVQYRYFGQDLFVRDYIRKIYNSLLDVRTDYVMLIDNDDFFSSNGIRRCINYLEKNGDYVACSGRSVSLEFLNNHRPDGRFRIRAAETSVDLDSESDKVAERLTSEVPVWNCVFRTEVLRLVFKEVSSLNLEDKDMHLYELFVNLAVLSSGKVKTLYEAFPYIRSHQRVHTSSVFFNYESRVERFNHLCSVGLTGTLVQFISHFNKARDFDSVLPAVEAVLIRINKAFVRSGDRDFVFRTKYKFLPRAVILFLRSLRYLLNQRFSCPSSALNARDFIRGRKFYFEDLNSVDPRADYSR